MDASHGTRLIDTERARQTGEENYTAALDDDYADGELIAAAIAYLRVNDELDVGIPEKVRKLTEARDLVADRDYRTNTARVIAELKTDPLQFVPAPAGWPWYQDSWKPSTDRQRNLVKAGALIAAELDRLERARLRGQEPAS